MNEYYVRKILDKSKLQNIHEIIENANKNNFWSDGLSSLPRGSKDIKNNLELANIDSIELINDLIMNSLDDDKKFNDFTIPLSTSLNIISKSSEGSYYNPHTDNWCNGDYSTTLFLNEPEEYDGGELCLYFGGSDEIKIKLKSGWGITYPTGILHRVNTVESGVRYVSVFWTKSAIKDSFIRNIYTEISNIGYNISNYNNLYITDCKSSLKDPLFCIDNLKHEILRRYSS
jgi:PKHD-type hydroxylase